MVVGKKYAVLVGCKYSENQEEMCGCGNDVQTMKKLLVECFYFKVDNITMMIEEESDDPLLEPTEKNIKQQIENMIKKAKRGDILFFFFSGLGKLVDNSPVIVSSDFEIITANYFRHQVNSLPKEVSFTFVCESSHSGGLIKWEKQQFPQVGSNPGAPNNGILFSACKADEMAARTVLDDNKLLTYGAFTSAFETVVRNHHPITNKELVQRVTEYLKSDNYGQQPCLYCADNIVDNLFLGSPKDDK